MRRAWSARADCTSTRPLPPNCSSSTSLCECSAPRGLSGPAPLGLDSLLAIQMRRRRVFRRGQMTAKPIAAMRIASTGPAPTSTARWCTACSEHRNPRALRARLAIPGAALLSLLLTACSAPTPQTAFNPRSDYAAEGLDLFQVIIVMGVVIGVLVEGVLIWAAIRYRLRSMATPSSR